MGCPAGNVTGNRQNVTTVSRAGTYTDDIVHPTLLEMPHPASESLRRQARLLEAMISGKLRQYFKAVTSGARVRLREQRRLCRPLYVAAFAQSVAFLIL